MKSVRLYLNLGQIDIDRLGLEGKKLEDCLEGSTIDVDDDQFAVITRNGWGVPPEQYVEPRTVTAPGVSPAVADADGTAAAKRTADADRAAADKSAKGAGGKADKK